MDKNNPNFMTYVPSVADHIDPIPSPTASTSANDDVIEGLRILLGTRPGERVMRPDYGCDLQSFLYGPMNAETIAAIKVAVRRAILMFEPLVVLKDVEVNTAEWNKGILAIHLRYIDNQTNASCEVVFPFYVGEGTLSSDTPVQLA